LVNKFKVPISGRYPEPIESNPHPISLRLVLLLSSHLRLCLPNVLFRWDIRQKFICISKYLHASWMSCLSHPPWFKHSNNIW